MARRIREIAISSLLVCSMAVPVNAGQSTEFYDTIIKPKGIGGYNIEVEAHEMPSNVVLPIVDKSYFPVSVAQYRTEIDNTAPSATYVAKKVAKADIVFALGETTQVQTITSNIPSFTTQMEAAGNYIDANVKQVETSTIDMSAFGAKEIFETY